MNIMWSISLFALMSDFRFLLINKLIQFLCFFYHLGNILINEPKLKQSYIKSKVAVMIAVLAPLVLQSTDQLFSLRNDAICSVLDLLKGNHWCLIFHDCLVSADNHILLTQFLIAMFLCCRWYFYLHKSQGCRAK